MAYTLLTAGAGLLTQTVRAGLSIADAALVAAAAAGNSFVNDGNVLVALLNTSAATVTVTVSAPNFQDTYGQLAVAGLSIVLGPGNVTAVRILTPVFPRTVYNQSDGTVHLDYSAVTNVKVAAIQQFRELTQ